MISSKLLLCKKCMTVKHSKASLCNNNIYRHLHEIHCSRCESNWLVCAQHELRFTPRKYFLAKRHLREVYHASVQLSTTRNTTKNQKVTNYLDNDFNSSMVSLDYNDDDTDDNINFNANENIRIDQFQSCHKEVSCDDYTII